MPVGPLKRLIRFVGIAQVALLSVVLTVGRIAHIRCYGAEG